MMEWPEESRQVTLRIDCLQEAQHVCYPYRIHRQPRG